MSKLQQQLRQVVKNFCFYLWLPLALPIALTIAPTLALPLSITLLLLFWRHILPCYHMAKRSAAMMCMNWTLWWVDNLLKMFHMNPTSQHLNPIIQHANPITQHANSITQYANPACKSSNHPARKSSNHPHLTFEWRSLSARYKYKM